jgi:hypothetical protein
MLQPGGGGPVAAAWLIDRSASPTKIVPLRATPVFCATVMLSVPAPEPEAGGASRIQLAPLDAVQTQPFGAVTATVAAPPAATNWAFSIAKRIWHDAAA